MPNPVALNPVLPGSPYSTPPQIYPPYNYPISSYNYPIHEPLKT